MLVFCVKDDVLYMHTTAATWNIGGLHGPFAELFFFLLKKDGKKRPSFLQRSQASDTTVDSCLGSTRVHRGRVSTLMCKNASLTAQVSGPERAVGKVMW